MKMLRGMIFGVLFSSMAYGMNSGDNESYTKKALIEKQKGYQESNKYKNAHRVS